MMKAVDIFITKNSLKVNERLIGLETNIAFFYLQTIYASRRSLRELNLDGITDVRWDMYKSGTLR